MYKDILRDYIINSKPTREDAQRRIDYGVAAGRLTADEAASLAGLLTDNTSLLEQDAAFAALVERVETLEAYHRDPALPDDVRDWVPPTGAHDAYAVGDKVRHEGVIYASRIDGNTTVPGSDPRWWEVAA